MLIAKILTRKLPVPGNFVLFFTCFVLFLFLQSLTPAQEEDSVKLFTRLRSANKPEQLKILYKIYFELYHLDPGKSVIYARKTAALARELNDQAEEAKAYYRISYYYRCRSMTDSALYFSRAGFDIGSKLGNNSLIASGYNSLGGVYLYSGQKIKALENLLKALALDSSNENLMSSAAFSLGILYADAGRTDKSVYYYLKSLHIDEKQQKWVDAAYCYCNLSGFYFQSLNFGEGIKSYNKALDLFNKARFWPGEAYVYNCLGMAYSEKSIHDSALKYYRKSMILNSVDTTGTRSGWVFNVTNIGDTWMKLEQYDSAQHYYSIALKWAIKGGDNIALSCIYLSLGELDTKLRHYSRAIEYLNKGLYHARLVSYRAQFEQAYTLLSECYEASGDRELALSYMKKRNAIRDSIFNVNARQEVANMMIRYETQKKDEEIMNLSIDTRVKQRKILIAWIVIFAILIIIAISAWYIWSYYSRKLVPKVKAMNFIEEKISMEKDGDNRKMRAIDRVLPPELKPFSHHQPEPQENSEELIAGLESRMSIDKIYLNENLSLAETAQILKTNTTYLSRLINEHYKVNFSAFLNKYRIEEAKKMILDDQYNNLSIEGIAKNAGFRSKSTFNQVFKQATGMTPTEFTLNNGKIRA